MTTPITTETGLSITTEGGVILVTEQDYFTFTLELFEVSRFKGVVALYWNLVPSATSYTIQNENQDLVLNAVSPATVSGLKAGVHYRFKVVANTPTGGVQSRAISFEFANTEIGEVEPLPWIDPGTKDT